MDVAQHEDNPRRQRTVFVKFWPQASGISLLQKRKFSDKMPYLSEKSKVFGKFIGLHELTIDAVLTILVERTALLQFLGTSTLFRDIRNSKPELPS